MIPILPMKAILTKLLNIVRFIKMLKKIKFKNKNKIFLGLDKNSRPRSRESTTPFSALPKY